MRDYLVLGDWNAICDVCGFKYKASQLRKNWKGQMVCAKDFEHRHPSDLFNPVLKEGSIPWARPEPSDVFITDIESQFLYTPSSGTAPFGVQFTDMSMGPPTTWSWDFGDGTTSTSQNPQKIYVYPGTYSVSLDTDTTTSTTKTNIITVSAGLDLLLWLDASDTSTITEVGGKVSQWNDKSTVGRNATQTDAAKRGERKTNRFTGGAIEFAAATGMDFSAVSLTAGTTVFMVGYWTAPSPVSHTSLVLASGDISLAGKDYVGAISDVSGDNSGSIAVADAGVTYAQSDYDTITTGKHIMEFAVVQDNSATKLVLDGVELDNTFLAGSSYSLSVDRIGLQPTYSSNANQLAEILIYNGVLSSSHRAIIRAALQDKWGTP